MSLTGALNIGANGLTAASLGTAVSGQNITNSATEGYSRQRTRQVPRPIPFGGGVSAQTPQRVQDAYVDRRLNTATSLEGQARARSESLADVDALFEDTAGNLAGALDGFETAMSDFANQPNSQAARDQLLARTTLLAGSFNQFAGRIDAAREDANNRIELSTEQLNDRLKAIATVNADIQAANAAGQETSTLMDQRDQLIRQVAEQVPVTVVDHMGGEISLLLGGSVSLVPLGAEPATLTTGLDANGNATVLKVGSSGITQDVTGLITSGSVAGYIEARDGAIADAQQGLDQLAFDVAGAYNAQHAVGTGKDGVSGRNLFDVTATATGAAAAITLSSDVAGNPDRLAASLGSWTAGDNRNALSMQALSNSRIAAGGTESAAEAYGSLVGRLGNAVQSANFRADHAESTLGQARALRDAVSGVNTDEEMVALMRYQRAYQASLRVIETADSMLAELMSMRR